MYKKNDLLNQIKKIMGEQLFAVLSTVGPEGPHSVIVSFVLSEDNKEIIFFTPRQTRKFSNILSNSRVTLFIDNRSNKITDTQRTLGIEVVGTAREVDAESCSDSLELYCRKYPEMSGFASAETTVAIRLTIERFEVVQHFQNVTILEPK